MRELCSERRRLALAEPGDDRIGRCGTRLHDLAERNEMPRRDDRACHHGGGTLLLERLPVAALDQLCDLKRGHGQSRKAEGMSIFRKQNMLVAIVKRVAQIKPMSGIRHLLAKLRRQDQVMVLRHAA